MRRLLYIAFLFTTLHLRAQTGDMLVYTVAGSSTATALGDGGPATAASIGETEGIWMDGSCNLYLTDNGHSSIRKVNTKTGIITTVAGNGHGGFSGDGNLAINAQIKPYGLYADSIGNVLIADAGNNRIRRVDAVTGIITTIAGGGGSLGDGGPATNAQLSAPQNVYEDNAGNIYIGEVARVRKINTSGIISTIAGTGISGLSGDGGLATNAQVYNASGMLMDGKGNLVFADRSNSRIRKIDLVTGIITTVAGKGGSGSCNYSGDNGTASAAELCGPISFVIDVYGNLIIGDNGNNYMRKVDGKTGIITTIAGIGSPSADVLSPDGTPATAAYMHPEFMYLDAEGDIYYSCYCNQIRLIAGYNPGLSGSANSCYTEAVKEVPQKNNDKIDIYPNPTYNILNINNLKTPATYCLQDIIGATMQQGTLKAGNNTISMRALPGGMYLLVLTPALSTGGAGGNQPSPNGYGGGGKTTYKIVKQ